MGGTQQFREASTFEGALQQLKELYLTYTEMYSLLLEEVYIIWDNDTAKYKIAVRFVK